MNIGVLAVQGAFAEHITALKALHCNALEIRNAEDCAQPMEGLILPGGESTTMGKLLGELHLFAPLQKKIQEGLPTFGTCAGLILLAKNLLGEEPTHLGLMDITVQRNAYGRQLGSFSTDAPITGIGNFPMVFIRAPYITKAGKGVQVLAEVEGKIVAAKEKNMLVTSFHPELTQNLSLHRYFLEEVSLRKKI